MTDDEVDDGGPCFCEGENPDWKYHHPTGCADTAQAFGLVADVSTTEAWDEPRPPSPEDSASRPINVGVCSECEERTLHYTDTAECIVCSVREEETR